MDECNSGKITKLPKITKINLRRKPKPRGKIVKVF